MKRKLKEEDRMSKIITSGIITPKVFIRINPDSRRNEHGKREEADLPKRMEAFLEEIKKWLNVDAKRKHFAEVIYLFYDGPKRQKDFVPISPEEYKEKMQMSSV